MLRKKRNDRKRQSGIALILALVFVAIFSALSMAMFTMSSSNTLIADNLHKANDARTTAESGLEVLRYYMGLVAIPVTVSVNNRFDWMVQNRLTGSSSILPSGFECTVIDSDTLQFSTLDLAAGKEFSAQMTREGTNGVTVRVTGTAGQITRTIASGFTYGTRPESVFDYGVATKGPLSLSGNILLDGINIAVESDVYIESMSNNNALEIIGNSQIAGDVKIVNPNASVDLQGGKAGIGGETGQDAIDNHVDIGVAATEFPVPDTAHFEQYVNGITIDSTNIGTYSTTGGTFENIRIAANTNPSFTGDVELKGVVFIESPNVVDFGGSADITGIIVGDGDMNDNSETNQLIFRGNVSSTSVSELPGSFGSLRDETGTFIMAPGFFVSMGGNFGTLNGCIAGNGIEFFGNAGGEIGGSILNYSDQAMTLSGNSDLYFNRSGITEIPAGFVQETVIHYDPTAYEEVL